MKYKITFCKKYTSYHSHASYEYVISNILKKKVINCVSPSKLYNMGIRTPDLRVKKVLAMKKFETNKIKKIKNPPTCLNVVFFNERRMNKHFL